jgi:UDP-N-acetylmuramyl pentapeptide synthase
MAGTAHIGELGSREAIAQAKGEIYAGLRAEGTACINLDDRFAAFWKGLVGERRVVTFGTAAAANVQGTLTESGLTLRIGTAEADVVLQVVGEHNQRNAIAAAAGAHAIGVSLANIAKGLANFAGVDGRLRAHLGHNLATIIDDTYNANPDSMRAAIAVLAKKSGRRLLVLGDMGELGLDAPSMHAEIGAEARAAKLDGLYVLGTLAREYATAFGASAVHAESVDSLIATLKPHLNADTTVLVKGSRFMKMERVVDGLLTDGTRASERLKGIH